MAGARATSLKRERSRLTGIMMTNSRIWQFAVTFILTGVQTAGAQTVSGALAFLVTNPGVQTGSIGQDRNATLATNDAISRGLLANLATLPIPTSSSGFLYRLNPELGTVERATASFGPFFVERALTSGRGQVSFAMTSQYLHFTSIDSQSLRDGSLMTTANQFVDASEPFDVDRLTLALDASVTTLHGSVGIADWIEVGVAAPIVSMFLDGSRVNTYRGRTFTQATAHTRSIGLADVVVRTKFTVFKEGGTALAGAVDLRLPTGRPEDLRGAGSRSLRLYGDRISRRQSSVRPCEWRVSVGGLANELSYAAALGFAASGRVTLIGEVLGRWDGRAGKDRAGGPPASPQGSRRLSGSSIRWDANLRPHGLDFPIRTVLAKPEGPGARFGARGIDCRPSAHSVLIHGRSRTRNCRSPRDRSRRTSAFAIAGRRTHARVPLRPPAATHRAPSRAVRCSYAWR